MTMQMINLEAIVLSDFKTLFLLKDAWRSKHPRERQFTWYNSTLSVASRLDTFLIARDLVLVSGSGSVKFPPVPFQIMILFF